MTNNPGIAHGERAELDVYIQRNAFVLTQPEVLDEIREYDFRKEYLYSSIGSLARCLAQVGEDFAAVNLVDRLLEATGNDRDKKAISRIWQAVAEKGGEVAGNELRESMGLSQDNEGNTLVPDDIDAEDVDTFNGLFALHQLGDEAVIPHLHRLIEARANEDASSAVNVVIKMYKAGDESAYELIKTTAQRARHYALEQVSDDKELSADDASDFAQMMKAMSSALGPSRSEAEAAYGSADIALRFFAKDFLENGDEARAQEMQGLMLGRFHNAWLNAQRFALGYDPDGKYAEAAKDYLEIHADDAGSHAFEITDALVRGGDEEIIAMYEDVYDSSMNPNDIDTGTVANMLVALHFSGDTRAHDRLIELLDGTKDSWLLAPKLEDMGFKDEAIAIAKKTFAAQPNYFNGLSLLNLQYDADAMEAVQHGASEFDGTIIDVIRTRSRHLGKLAAHIVAIERTT